MRKIIRIIVKDIIPLLLIIAISVIGPAIISIYHSITTTTAGRANLPAAVFSVR